MKFIEANLESILAHLSQLEQGTKAKWGDMSAQRMVEHLTDVTLLSAGHHPQDLLVPEEKLESMRRFLYSDKPMAKNIEVPFAKKDTPLRNDEIELAVDEFVDAWLEFEEYYSKDESKTVVHSYYGPLNYKDWLQLHSKHFSHHLAQFGLIEE